MKKVAKKLSQEEFLRAIRDHLASLKESKKHRKRPRTYRMVMGSYRNYICSGHMVICTRRANPIRCEKCRKEMIRIGYG